MRQSQVVDIDIRLSYLQTAVLTQQRMDSQFYKIY